MSEVSKILAQTEAGDRVAVGQLLPITGREAIVEMLGISVHEVRHK